MDGCERAVMTGVHCLKHVERFAAAALADDDAVRTHSQGVADEIADVDFAFAFDVRRTRFEADHMILAQLEFRRVFNGDDAFGIGQERAQNVEQRRFSGTGSAGDDDVFAEFDADVQEIRHFVRD